MKTNLVFVVTATLASFALNAAAQTPPPPPKQPQQAAGQPAVPQAAPCPRIEVKTMNQLVRDGEQINFNAEITGGDPNVQPVYSWTTSSGLMTGGQGTRSIAVDTTGAGADRQIIAEIWVGGYAPECTVQAKTGVVVAGPAKKVDEFGDLPLDKETARLEAFAGSLSPSHDQGYVIAYAGRTNERGYASTALKRMKAAIAKTGFPADRVATIDGGFREQPAYELFIVPVGAERPKATPTVDRKEIVYPKPTPPVKKP